jgi:hypothetical protein
VQPETPSPIDLPAPELEAEGLGWASGVIAIAGLFLLAANGQSLRDWIDDQSPGPAQSEAAMLADQWVHLTEALGVGLPRQAMHAQWKRAEEARFPTAHPEGRAITGPTDQR